eukprot:2275955-Pleurochrysis_carterae.AAC.4
MFKKARGTGRTMQLAYLVDLFKAHFLLAPVEVALEEGPVALDAPAVFGHVRELCKLEWHSCAGPLPSSSPFAFAESMGTSGYTNAALLLPLLLQADLSSTKLASLGHRRASVRLEERDDAVLRRHRVVSVEEYPLQCELTLMLLQEHLVVALRRIGLWIEAGLVDLFRGGHCWRGRPLRLGKRRHPDVAVG